jgi:hypothetical protein
LFDKVFRTNIELEPAVKSKIQVQKFLIAISLLGLSCIVQADCKNPAPRASAFSNPGNGSCPSGYYSSGAACAPTSSARYAFSNPGGGGCPSGYYSSGNACVASSDNTCNAFFSGGGSCPSGYYSSGKSCVAN